MKPITFAITLCCVAAVRLQAQDPTKVDPMHYKVEYEDPGVRVLRVTFGPHEKSVMHEHPFGQCVIRITDENTKHTTPNGETSESHAKAGTTECTAVKPGKELHNPENLSAQRLELIVVERKR